MANYLADCLKSRSNRIIYETDLIQTQLGEGSSARVQLHSASFFSLYPPGRESAIRRCLLSLSLVFQPGPEKFLNQCTYDMTFMSGTPTQPTVLGYQFLDLKRHTRFLTYFKRSLKTAPTELGDDWYTAGFETLFTGEAYYSEGPEVLWAEGRNSSRLKVFGLGDMGRAPGIVHTVPLTVLLELDDLHPPYLSMNLTLWGALVSEDRDQPKEPSYELEFRDVLVTRYPPLPMVSGDRPERYHSAARASHGSTEVPNRQQPPLHGPSARSPVAILSGLIDPAREASTLDPKVLPLQPIPSSSTIASAPPSSPAEIVSSQSASVYSRILSWVRAGAVGPQTKAGGVSLSATGTPLPGPMTAVLRYLERLDAIRFGSALEEGETAFLAAMRRMLGSNYPIYKNFTWKDCSQVVFRIFAQAHSMH